MIQANAETGWLGLAAAVSAFAAAVPVELSQRFGDWLEIGPDWSRGEMLVSAALLPYFLLEEAVYQVQEGVQRLHERFGPIWRLFTQPLERM